MDEKKQLAEELTAAAEELTAAAEKTAGRPLTAQERRKMDEFAESFLLLLNETEE